MPPQRVWSYFASNAGTFTNNSQSNPLFSAADVSWFKTPQKFNLQVEPGSPANGAGLAGDAPETDIMESPAQALRISGRTKAGKARESSRDGKSPARGPPAKYVQGHGKLSEIVETPH